MNLPMRQDKKRNQALDAFASVAKTWSEWRLGERATKTVAKGTKKASKSTAKARKRAAKAAKKADASTVSRAMKGRPLKIAGAVALAGGVGAAIAKKLKGPGTAEPLHTTPTSTVTVSGVNATESAVAASEKAATAATAPPPAGTEPSVPDTDVDAAADTTGDDEVEDAMDVHSESEADDTPATPSDDSKS